METNHEEDGYKGSIIESIMTYLGEYAIEGVSYKDIRLHENGGLNQENADFQLIVIDEATSKNLKRFDLDYLIKYAVKNEIFFKHKEVIKAVGLQDYELLVMILLCKGIWGKAKTTRQIKHLDNLQKSKSLISRDIEEFNKFIRLYQLLKDQYDYYNDLQANPLSNEVPKSILEKVSFTFRDESINENVTIEYLSKDQYSINPILKIILKYANTMKSNPDELYEDLGIEGFDLLFYKQRSERNIINPHHLFCYNFIELIKSEFIKKQKRVVLREIYGIYIALLRESGYKINTDLNVPGSEESNIKKWYSTAKKVLKQE
ncbi:hypothetical protein L0657_19875 [Dyadobacter sp. CY345]|uniref:hypothetical protein n=1 Tax=Dyadobacter sp. CY345 TaxID=2909335 RepID=UPI001F4590DD|nr:hypothetical protein [Dyadobacter sp. CY345]MCF2446226.1 hypothetical protein [Dyadobacter sp. CY345]